jgi:hypothetical protein
MEATQPGDPKGQQQGVTRTEQQIGDWLGGQSRREVG